MASPVWPTATVPANPEAGTYSEQRLQSGSSFQPDVGPPSQFRRTTLKASNIKATFSWTGAQKTAFFAFYDDDLDGGTRPFLWTNPVYGVEERYVFDIGNGPQVSDAGYDRYAVTVSIFRLQ